MGKHAKLLFIAGSIRTGSFNAKLAEAAARIADTLDNVTVSRINLADFDMPLYNADYEIANGLPDSARQLKRLFREHHGFLIASPEYNSSICPLLVNTIAWLSRPESKDEPGLVAFKGKVAALVAASPGALGGLRGLVPLRMMLSNIGTQVVPPQLAVAGAGSAFDDNGQLGDGNKQQALAGVVKSLIATAGAIGYAE